MGAKLVLFTVTVVPRFLGFSVTVELGKENKTRYNVTNLAVLTNFQPFHLNKCSPDCCKFLANLSSCKKVDLKNFLMSC